jgi:hypothetical protein
MAVKFWKPGPGETTKVVTLHRIPLCDEGGEPTGAFITFTTADALGQAYTAALRLGALVHGIYMDPNDSTKSPQIITTATQKRRKTP